MICQVNIQSLYGLLNFLKMIIAL